MQRFDPARIDPGPLRGLIAVAAMAENRVIGSGGSIPWRLPDDFRWFKHVTMGHSLLMGRRTWDSLGRRPLPGRHHIVVTKQAVLENVETALDLGSILERPPADPLFVIGGGEIYRQCLPRCSTVLLTLVHATPSGDTFFPPFEGQFFPGTALHQSPEFDILRFDSKSA